MNYTNYHNIPSTPPLHTVHAAKRLTAITHVNLLLSQLSTMKPDTFPTSDLTKTPSYHPGLLDSKPSSSKPITLVSASGSPWVIVIRQREAGGIYCPLGLLRVVILSVLLKTSHVGFSAWVVMFLFFSLHCKTLYFSSEEKYVANILDFTFICWPSVPGK